MPYKYITERWHLPEQYNRRIKLTASNKEKIKDIYNRKKMSIHAIARLYGVSKRLIQFVIFPDRVEKNKELRAIRGGSKRYYDRERNRLAQKDTRNYKQKIYLNTRGNKDESY